MLKTPFQIGQRSRSLTTKNWIFNHGAYIDYHIKTSECRMRQLIFRKYDDNTCVFLCRRHARPYDVYRFGKNLNFDEITKIQENIQWGFEHNGTIPKYITEKLKIIIQILTKAINVDETYSLEQSYANNGHRLITFFEKILWNFQKPSILTELECKYESSSSLKYPLRNLAAKGVSSLKDIKEKLPERSLRKYLFSAALEESSTGAKLDRINRELGIVYSLKNKHIDINHILTFLGIKRTYYDYYQFLDRISTKDYLRWYNLLKTYGTYDYLYKDTYNYFYYYQNECRKRNVAPAHVALKANNLQKSHDTLVELWNKIKFAPEPVNNPVELANIDSLNDEKYLYILPEITADLKTWGNIMSNCIGGYKPNRYTGLVAIKDTISNKMLYNIELRIENARYTDVKSVVFYQFMAFGNRRATEEESGGIKKALTALILGFKVKTTVELIGS
jgi:hypothetical protein